MAVTPSDVKEIFDTDLGDAQVQQHLNAASRLVSRELDGVDQGVQDDVRKYLTAHLASTQDQRTSATSVGDVDVEYQGETKMGLNSTIYGQQAMMMDPTDNLRKLSEGRKKAKLDFMSRADDQ